MVSKTIPVIGMACASCSAHVERKLNSMPGIQSAAVSLPGRNVLVTYDEHAISLEQMKNEVNAIGYDLVIEEDRSAEEIERNEYRQLRRKTLLSWLFAALCMAVSMRWINLGSRHMAHQAALLLSLANLLRQAVLCCRVETVAA